MSDWNEDWNKTEDELTASEKAARQEYLDGLMWNDRLARSRRSASTPVGRESAHRESVAYGHGAAVARTRTAAGTRKRRPAWIGYAVAGGMMVLGYILIACGAFALDRNPSSSFAKDWMPP